MLAAAALGYDCPVDDRGLLVVDMGDGEVTIEPDPSILKSGEGVLGGAAIIDIGEEVRK